MSGQQHQVLREAVATGHLIAGPSRPQFAARPWSKRRLQTLDTPIARGRSSARLSAAEEGSRVGQESQNGGIYLTSRQRDTAKREAAVQRPRRSANLMPDSLPSHRPKPRTFVGYLAEKSVGDRRVAIKIAFKAEPLFLRCFAATKINETTQSLFLAPSDGLCCQPSPG
jgi:hypothetical protein